jgi:hypothetical protein
MFNNKKRKDIDTVAKEDAELILRDAATLTEAIEDYRELDNAEYFMILTSAIALFYILLDRMAFSKMSENQRDNFSDLVLFYIQEDLAANTGVNKDIIPKLINSNLKVFTPYSQRLYPDNKEDGMKGTLFWEYAKIISNDFELGPDAVLQIPLFAMRLGADFMEIAAESLESLD